MSNNKKTKVLFVCMGNICRSPTAEGIFTKLINDQVLQDQFEIDSAGTHAYHIGEPPDGRSQQAIMQRGMNISHLRARKVTQQDFVEFDYIISMDSHNYADMMAHCPSEYQAKIKPFLSFAADIQETDVPDPYYGGGNGFEHVLDLCEVASVELLKAIQAE